MKKKIPVRMIRPMVSRSLYYRFILARCLERIAYLWKWPVLGLGHLFAAILWLAETCCDWLIAFHDSSRRAWSRMVANAMMSKEELDLIWDAFDEVRKACYPIEHDEGSI